MTRSKYGNRKTVVDGITFSSAREAQKYQEYRLLQRGGTITHLVLQPRFELLPTFKKNGVTHRSIVYVADFDITWKCGKREIVDVKGMKTEVFRIKQKLFEHKFPDLTLTLA